MLNKLPSASASLPCLSILLVSLPTGTEWVDPEDPTVIAENELLGAAAAIEAAAKKLEQLKPRAKPKVRTVPSPPPSSPFLEPPRALPLCDLSL